jgi:quercetin dioxygenase-like cupin family protein
MHVEHWDQRTDGELTESALRRKLEKMGYRVSVYVYPPGTYFGSHAHDLDKIDAVLSGEFLVSMRGQSVTLRPGDSLFVPAGVGHSAEVIGKDPVVSLDGLKI